MTSGADDTGVHSVLTGRRGWTTVVALSAALLCTVTGQVYAAAASPSGRQDAGVAFVAAETPQDAGYDRPVPALVAARAAAAVEQARQEAERREAERQEAERREAERQEAERQEAERQAGRQARRAAEQPAGARADLCSGPGWQQRRGEAALASLGPAVRASGFRVEFAPARKGYLGLAHLQRGVVEIFVRDCGAQSDELLRHVIAHELGHAYDTARMADASREAYKAARGIAPSVPWYGCSGCADFATPAGDFAEVYAQWLRGAASNRSQLAAAPGPAQLQELARRFFGA